MAKHVRTARGDLIDWDLLKIQSVQNNNVAEKVEIVNRNEQLVRREQRARMEAARKLLQQAEQQKKQATVSEAQEDDNGWDDNA